ncbi:MAG: rhomboid family intramembrane serine protease [Saprospiraceae bacterium]|nr:rhomboid family intramembrane serine protease [Saprospiraceae bacterium]
MSDISTEKYISQFIYRIRWSVVLLIFLWAVFIADKSWNLGLMYYGIYPRQTYGIIGILTAPFIHGDWSHLISNSSPVLVLTVIMTFFYKRVALASFILITLGTGLLVWMFGRESYHIGASGVVYGLVAFVFWSGVFRKNMKSIVLALIIVVMYSGLFENLFPSEKVNISWESHLFGAIVGLMAAFVFKNVKEEDEVTQHNPWENDNTEQQFFYREIPLKKQSWKDITNIWKLSAE